MERMAGVADLTTSISKPLVPLRIAVLSGKALMEAAPDVLKESPAWCSMRDDEKRLFWAIYNEIESEAAGYRTAAEVYQIADLQFGLVTERPTDADRTSKSEEARLKRQRTWLEQMEKLRKDKGDASKGVKEVLQALLAVRKKDGRPAAWLVEFGEPDALTIETEAVDDDSDIE